MKNTSIIQATFKDYYDEFNLLLSKIENIITDLNIKHNFNYRKDKIISIKLLDTLRSTCKEFFTSQPTTQSLEKFEKNYNDAISIEMHTFEKHRGWGGLDFYLKAFLTLLAHITILPVIVVALYSKHGYQTTFFGNYKTDSSEKLTALKIEIDTLCSRLKNEILNENSHFHNTCSDALKEILNDLNYNDGVELNLGKIIKIYSGNQLTKTSYMEDIDEDESPIDILLSKNKIEYVYENDNNQSTSTTVTEEIVDDSNITRPTF